MPNNSSNKGFRIPKNTLIGGVVLLLVAAFVFWWIYNQFSFNFASVGIILMILCVVVPIFFHRSTREDCEYNVLSMGYSIVAFVCILSFGGLCIYTIDNYFYPDQEIFTNADHHVVRIDGLEISNPTGFVLAENSSKALYDNEANIGSLKISGWNDSCVQLQVSPDFLRALYLENYSDDDRLISLRLADGLQLPSFAKGDSLWLQTMGDEDHSPRTFVMRTVVHKDAEEDIADYTIDGIVSDTHSYLRRGNSLSSLLNGLRIDSIGLDLEGIHLVRPYARVTEAKIEDLINKYYLDEAFCIEAQRRNSPLAHNTVVRVSTDGTRWYSLFGNNNGSEYYVNIPYDRFFSVGYDTKKSSPMKFVKGENDALKILYKLPMRRYLSPGDGRPDNMVLLTQSLNCQDRGIDESYALLPDNVMLFDIFAHVDNVNRMMPKYLTYTGTSTRDSFYVDVYDYRSTRQKQVVSHGQALADTRAINGNNNVQWIVKVENLKESSPYQPTAIKWKIFLFVLALALLMLYGNGNLTRSPRASRPMYSCVEYVAYMVTIFLVTLRWFLLWRVSVFPPVESVSAYDYGMFQRMTNLNWLNMVMVAFVAVVAVMKFCFIHREQSVSIIDSIVESMPIRAISNGFDKTVMRFFRFMFGSVWPLKIIAGVLIFAAYTFLLISCKWLPTTWIGIFLPVLIYIGVSLIIHHAGSHSYISSRAGTRTIERGGENNKKKSYESTYSNAKAVLIADALNCLAASTALTLIDSGYGIIFLTYSVFWMLWSLYDYARWSEGEIWKGNALGKVLLLLLFIFFAVLIWKYKEMFRYLALGGDDVYLAAAGIGALLALSVVIIMVGVKGVAKYWKSSVGVVLLGTLAFGSIAFGVNKYLSVKAQHTVQRIKVLSVQPDEALLSIGDNDNQRRYIQAAVNHMIIGEYNHRGEDVSLLGANGLGYFNMQPHSKVGAMWGAQLTDISLVRFLIAEHSTLLPRILIALFLIMLLVAAREVKHHRFARWILLQIPLLLLIQSLLIWMANTQRFVFLGQDFPMISVNSALSLAFYMSLMIVWLFGIFSEKSTESEIDDARFFDNLQTESMVDVTLLGVPLGAGLIFAFWFIDSMQYNVEAPNAMRSVVQAVTSDNDYDEAEEIYAEDDEDYADRNEADPSSVNGWLLKYQKDGNRPASMYPSALASYIADFDKTYRKEICKCFGVEVDEDGNVTYVNGSNALGLNMWDNFVKEGVKKNSRKNIMHARLNGKGNIVIAVSNKFIPQSLPRNTWEGSLVAGDSKRGMVGIHRGANGQALYVLPEGWTRSGRETALLAVPRNADSHLTAHVIGPDMGVELASNTHRCAAQVLPGYRVNQQALAEMVPHTDFIARNVRVNGARQFVYPLGEKLFWANSFASELQARKSMQEEEIRNHADYNYDANLSLSSDLQGRLYDIFATTEANKSSIKELSVIVANGDGEIQAMVDYKRDYKLNPNDQRRISYITDSLYLIGAEGGATARGYFGNNNLMALKYGPGSSQKPLTWTAVAAGIEYPWRNLAIETYQPYFRIEDKKFVIPKFNGQNFLTKHPFRAPLGDENQGQRSTLADYMSHSSNIYNAVMIYLGSWTADAYTDNFVSTSSSRDDATLFAQLPSAWKTEEVYLDNFPLLINGGRPFTLNAHPTGGSGAWLAPTVFQQNMTDMFGFNAEFKKWDEQIASDHKRGGHASWSLAEGHEAFAVGKDKTPTMSYVEPSAIRSEVRSEDPRPRNEKHNYFMENGIRQTAIGDQNVWNVTPLQMAEAYGRMVSLNNNYHLSVFRDSIEYEMMPGLSHGYLEARPMQFRGMNDIFTNGTLGGGALRALGHHNGYWLYAKTGTIGPKGKNRHRLGLIIADHDLTTVTADQLNDVKYYVMYFATDSERIEKGKYYRAALDAVMDSQSFKDYMGQQN